MGWSVLRYQRNHSACSMDTSLFNSNKSVFIIHFYVTECPPNSSLKPTDPSDLTVSVSQESGNSLDGCLQVCPEVAVSSQGSAWEDPPPHSVTSLAGSSSLWIIGLGASVPFSSHGQFPTWQLSSFKAGEQDRILPICHSLTQSWK